MAHSATQLIRLRAHFAACAGMLCALSATIAVANATAAAAERAPSAVAARVISATDTAHLSYLPGASEGATLVEEGVAVGRLPGRMRATLTAGSSFSGSFVFRTVGGTIRGRGSATPHGSGRYESFRGTLVVTGGTRRYAHAHGRAGLYGVFDRDTFAVTIQTTGSIYY